MKNPYLAVTICNVIVFTFSLCWTNHPDMMAAGFIGMQVGALAYKIALEGDI